MTSELPKNSSESAQSTEKLNHVARKRIATTMAAIAMSASALIGSGAVVDAYVSVAIDPKKEATIINHSPESCHQASFSIVYFDPTGKPVSQHLAILNKSIVDEYGGASLSLHYGDQYDIDELAEKINYVLELCEQSGKPVILSGQSLGVKIAQEVANSGKVKNVIAIFQESTPTGPEDIKSDINRKLVTSLQEVPITPGKVTMSAFSAISSVQRGKNPFEPIEMKDNQISVDETSPRVLLWQRQANAKPYPENNAPIPIYYLYSSKDGRNYVLVTPQHFI